MNLLQIVDQFGWAYDRVAKDIQKHVPKNWLTITVNWPTLKTNAIDWRAFDAIIMWPWISGGNQIFHTDLIHPARRGNTIFMVASKAAAELVLKTNELPDVKYIGVVNKQYQESIQKKHPNIIVFNLEHGVDLEKFTYSDPPEEFSVGWIGRKDRKLKRWPMAYQAATLAHVPLRVAEGLGERYYINPDQMPEFYHSISALLITSDQEGHPLINYEALATGTPVISTLVGDISETARDGLNGFYLPVNIDSPDVEEKIRALKEAPDLLAKMAKRARRDAAKWSWEKKIENYLEAIRYASDGYTAAMLISREGTLPERALTSILSKHPTTTDLYVDTDKTTLDKVKNLATEVARRVNYTGQIKIAPQVKQPNIDPHDDVTRNVYYAITRAEYPRVLWLDDDDELLIDPAYYTPDMTKNTGVVYGDVEQHSEDGTTKLVESHPATNSQEIRGIKGSAAIYNRDAVKEVQPNVDVFNNIDPHPEWYGYFWDWQLAFHLQKKGYILKYEKATWSIQNINPEPSEKRLSLYGKWRDITDYYEKEPQTQ